MSLPSALRFLVLAPLFIACDLPAPTSVEPFGISSTGGGARTYTAPVATAISDAWLSLSQAHGLRVSHR